MEGSVRSGFLCGGGEEGGEGGGQTGEKKWRKRKLIKQKKRGKETLKFVP